MQRMEERRGGGDGEPVERKESVFSPERNEVCSCVCVGEQLLSVSVMGLQPHYAELPVLVTGSFAFTERHLKWPQGKQISVSSQTHTHKHTHTDE